MNLLVLASLVGFGLVVKAVASCKKYDKKNRKKPPFPELSTKTILDSIRFYLRGEPIEEKTFLHRLKMIDDFVSDHCMEIPEKFKVNYARNFAVV